MSIDDQLTALRAEKRALRAEIKKLVAARKKTGKTLRKVGREAIASSARKHFVKTLIGAIRN